MTQELEDNQISTRLKNELSQMADSYVYKHTPSFNSLRKHKILQKLKCNEDIVMTYPDRGNGVVILNRDEYIKSMTELTSDFRKLKEDPTLKRERPARSYGTPKILKVSLPGSLPPFQPAVSSIGTYNNNLAQYLGSFLSPHIISVYSTKDSFTFIEEVKLVNVADKFLILFDVKTLFTNIPLSDAINIAINLIFENSPNIKLTKRERRKLFRIATSETHFTFNGSVFDQIDSVAMSSSLAPALANLFMGFHEQNWIEQATNVKPIFYKMYVDDIFAVFESESHADAFYSYLNTRHENIKFTFEKERDNKLPFVDILINNNESDLQTLIFHEKTYTGLLLNYFSFVPNCYKLGLIKTLVDRMYRINNSWTGFDKDLKGLKNILQKNQYPLKMIDHVIKLYLNDKINCRNERSSENTKSEIKIRYFKLPFIRLHLKLTQKKVDQFCKRFCKSLKVKLVFTNENLRCAFSTKDPYQS